MMMTMTTLTISWALMMLLQLPEDDPIRQATMDGLLLKLVSTHRARPQITIS